MPVSDPKPDATESEKVAQLKADVAVFMEEMRLARVNDSRDTWLPFALGAGVALLVVALAFVIARMT